MKFPALLLALAGLVSTAHAGSAQAPIRYRAYALGSDAAAVLEITKGRSSDVRTSHARPARIEAVSWVAPAPYISSDGAPLGRRTKPAFHP